MVEAVGEVEEAMEEAVTRMEALVDTAEDAAETAGMAVTVAEEMVEQAAASQSPPETEPPHRWDPAAVRPPWRPTVAGADPRAESLARGRSLAEHDTTATAAGTCGSSCLPFAAAADVRRHVRLPQRPRGVIRCRPFSLRSLAAEAEPRLSDSTAARCTTAASGCAGCRGATVGVDPTTPTAAAAATTARGAAAAPAARGGGSGCCDGSGARWCASCCAADTAASCRESTARTGWRQRGRRRRRAACTAAAWRRGSAIRRAYYAPCDRLYSALSRRHSR